MTYQTPTKAFGQWLKHYRQAQDIDAVTLAEHAGCSIWTLRKIEAGTLRPSRQLTGRLAQALGLHPAVYADFLRAARTRMAPNPDALRQPPS